MSVNQEGYESWESKKKEETIAQFHHLIKANKGKNEKLVKMAIQGIRELGGVYVED
jgi:hypothetical protein